MKFYFIYVAILVMIFCTGCSKDVQVDSLPVDQITIDDDYISYVSEDEYFRVVTYVQPVLISGEPIDIYSTIQYVGTKETFRIWHALSNFYHSFSADNGMSSVAIINHFGADTVFRKGEMILVPFGKPEFLDDDNYNDEQKEFFEIYKSFNKFALPPGIYTIRGNCAFSLTKAMEDYTNFTEFEIIVE
jgi:hypothetical protein